MRAGRGIQAGDEDRTRPRLQTCQPVRIMAGDLRGQDRCRVRTDRARIAQDLRRRPDGRDPPGPQRHDGGGQPRDLGAGMADIEDRHAGLVAQAFEIGQDLGLAGLVQGGQRLVRQDQARGGQQGAPDGHAAALSAGQGSGAAGQQRADAQHLHHAIQIGRGGVARREPPAIEQVLADRQMREQPPLLEDIAKAAAVGGQVAPQGAVGQDPVIDRDPPRIRSQQARDRVHDRGLARTGWPEQHRQPRGGVERHVQVEPGKPVGQADLQRHAPATRRATRRARTSDSSSAVMAMVIDTKTKRPAAASPPGACSRA